MSGVDRAVLGRKLEKLGWTENEYGLYSPPDSLFKEMPKSFTEYNAESLQDLLGEFVSYELKEILGRDRNE